MTSGSNVYDTMTQIASIQRGITDPITGRALVAYGNVPYTISAADMPLFVNIVGALTRNVLAGSDSRAREFNETRLYQMTLYGGAYGTGVEGEMLAKLTPYFSLVYYRFGLYPHLNKLSGILDAKIVTDTGTTVVGFAGNQYFGIRFNLQVISKIRRPLGEDE